MEAILAGIAKLDSATLQLPQDEQPLEARSLLAGLRGIATAESELRSALAALGPPPKGGWTLDEPPSHPLMFKVGGACCKRHRLGCAASLCEELTDRAVPCVQRCRSP